MGMGSNGRVSVAVEAVMCKVLIGIISDVAAGRANLSWPDSRVGIKHRKYREP
jgi:hypothetical protein